MTQNERAAEMAAEWWAQRLMRGDKTLFKEHIRAGVLMALDAGEPGVDLECDYDPRGLLLGAVRAAGVECPGFLFSARGILPEKHTLDVMAHKLVPKEGYGNWTAEIPVPTA